MTFPTLYIIQHFVLYRGNKPESDSLEQDAEPLLADEPA